MRNGSTVANSAVFIQPVDMDGDGDIDVVTAAYNGNEFAWYENTETTTPITTTVTKGTNAHVVARVNSTHATIYINGQEAGRFGMPSGDIDYLTYAFT